MIKITSTFDETECPLIYGSAHRSKHTSEFNVETLNDIIPEFEKFMLGLGYVLPHGHHIGIKKDEKVTDDFRECLEKGDVPRDFRQYVVETTLL